MHEDIYFYHSFPPSNDRALGLKVLESILRYGFLLTPEKQVFVQTRNLGEMTIVQKRACFTAIPSRELGAHANAFGPFALEFEPQALRDFGVLPVVYTAGKLLGGGLLHGSGQVLARQLLESYWVMSELVAFAKPGSCN